jgi:hypothetical protein
VKDPVRLLRSGTRAADCLRAYAARTTAGDRSGAAAWHRLQERLEASAHAAPAPLLSRRRWAWSPSRLFALALGLFVLLKLVPSPRGLDDAALVISDGGFAGGGGVEGAGGMEGTGG